MYGVESAQQIEEYFNIMYSRVVLFCYFNKNTFCSVTPGPEISVQKIVGNSFQPIAGLMTGNSIHQGFRWKVRVDVIGQIGYIQFPRIL